MYTIGRSAANFPDPLRFMPERWQRDEVTGSLKGVNNASATLPFALGARSCIGRKMAEIQINQLISTVSDNFPLDGLVLIFLRTILLYFSC